MRKTLKSTLAAALCGATAFAALPPEVLAGPMSAASPSSVGLTAPAEKVYYRRYFGPRRYYGGYHPRRYYRHYGYDPSGAIFAGAALGLLGAGIAAASQPYYGYGYPWYYGYGYPGYYGYGSPAYGYGYPWGW
jgi:hypothetical protein